MTAHLAAGGPLWAEPERVARDILRAVESGRAVLYTPWFWRGVMLGRPRPAAPALPPHSTLTENAPGRS